MSDELQMKIGELSGRQAMLEARLTMFEAKFDKKLDEIMAAITKMKTEPSGLWKPKVGEDYYFIGCDVSAEGTYNEGNDTDKRIIKQGNAYRTKEEAEHARDKQEVTQRLRELAGGYRFKAGADNWYLFCNTGTKEWITGYCLFSFHPNAVYFPTEESALAARDELGQRLNVLLT